MEVGPRRDKRRRRQGKLGNGYRIASEELVDVEADAKVHEEDAPVVRRAVIDVHRVSSVFRAARMHQSRRGPLTTHLTILLAENVTSKTRLE